MRNDNKSEQTRRKIIEAVLIETLTQNKDATEQSTKEAIVTPCTIGVYCLLSNDGHKKNDWVININRFKSTILALIELCTKENLLKQLQPRHRDTAGSTLFELLRFFEGLAEDELLSACMDYIHVDCEGECMPAENLEEIDKHYDFNAALTGEGGYFFTDLVQDNENIEALKDAYRQIKKQPESRRA